MALSAAEPRAAFVTGGAGFVGSTLVERLLADGWRVTAFDSFDPFYDPEAKRRNLSQAASHPSFALVAGDTADDGAVVAAAREARPHVVFDLAARAGVRPSIADPVAYGRTNVLGLQHTLQAAAQVGARVVFASSSSIYGADDRRPYREDQARGRPESPYGATKVAGEALCHAHHAITGLPVGVARLFTVFGPRQRPDLAIHKFARSILAGRPVELFDAGRPVRDYTYVDDVVEALVRLANTTQPYLVANVGNEHPMSTLAMLEVLETTLGRTAERVLLPAQPGDVPATHADISRARETLGWAPQVPFEEGIRRFCDWLLAQPDATVAEDSGAATSAESEPSSGAGRPTAR